MARLKPGQTRRMKMTRGSLKGKTMLMRAGPSGHTFPADAAGRAMLPSAKKKKASAKRTRVRRARSA